MIVAASRDRKRGTALRCNKCEIQGEIQGEI
jgi:hypothetical protein